MRARDRNDIELCMPTGVRTSALLDLSSPRLSVKFDGVAARETVVSFLVCVFVFAVIGVDR